ncbi:hypothetical protein HPG69_011327, partial [Diceros bicornis minor]
MSCQIQQNYSFQSEFIASCLVNLHQPPIPPSFLLDLDFHPDGVALRGMGHFPLTHPWDFLENYFLDKEMGDHLTILHRLAGPQ